jgi:hypothetical protein
MYLIPPYKKSILTVRFTGEDFEEHGVAVYDFATTLLSLQRIFHKAYLAMHSRLEFAQTPKKEERKTLSLMIGERQHASDAFGLIPILTDPTTHQLLIKVADYVASGMIGYYVGDVLDRIKKEKDPDKQIFIGSIHAEVVNIVGRIDAAGGVDSIQIGAPLSGQPLFCKFSTDSKEYIKTLTDQYFLGTYQTIRGNVYRLYPNSRYVTIRRAGGVKVDVHVNEEDFESIRYHTGRNPLVSFTGRPRFKFGVESKSITMFEAESIQIHDQTEQVT